MAALRLGSRAQLGVAGRLLGARLGCHARPGTPPGASSAPSSAIGPNGVLVLGGAADVAPRCRLGGGRACGSRPGG
eukprot:1171491-Alexandrium_andersonii.AAC.1